MTWFDSLVLIAIILGTAAVAVAIFVGTVLAYIFFQMADAVFRWWRRP